VKPPILKFRRNEEERELQAPLIRHRKGLLPLFATNADTDDALYAFHSSHDRRDIFGRFSAWVHGEWFGGIFRGMFP
jgi:hypothetical protein